MTTGRCRPTTGGPRPGRAIDTGPDGPWRAVGRPRPQLPAAEEATNTEAARAKTETKARAARRRRKLEKEASTSRCWYFVLWASAILAWAGLAATVCRAAKHYLTFSFAVVLAAATLSGSRMADAILVYDREHPATTYRTINLHEPHDSLDPETDYLHRGPCGQDPGLPRHPDQGGHLQ